MPRLSPPSDLSFRNILSPYFKPAGSQLFLPPGNCSGRPGSLSAKALLNAWKRKFVEKHRRSLNNQERRVFLTRLYLLLQKGIIFFFPPRRWLPDVSRVNYESSGKTSSFPLNGAHNFFKRAAREIGPADGACKQGVPGKKHPAAVIEADRPLLCPGVAGLAKLLCQKVSFVPVFKEMTGFHRFCYAPL